MSPGLCECPSQPCMGDFVWGAVACSEHGQSAGEWKEEPQLPPSNPPSWGKSTPSKSFSLAWLKAGLHHPFWWYRRECSIGMYRLRLMSPASYIPAVFLSPLSLVCSPWDGSYVLCTARAAEREPQLCQLWDDLLQSSTEEDVGSPAINK